MTSSFYYPAEHRRRKKPPPPPPPPPTSPRIPPPEYDTPEYLALYNKFVAYHGANPRLYELINQYAHAAIDADQKNYGVAAIFEVLRWDYTVRAYDPTLNFKLPNNHRAFYSRLWTYNNREYSGFFRQQIQRSGRRVRTDEYGQPI